MYQKKINDWSKSILKSQSTIKTSLRNLNKTGLQIVLMCNEKNQLLGTVTDGDIRRGLLNGKSLNDPISSIANKKPFYIFDNKKYNDAIKIMSINKIKALPVLDRSKKIVNIYFNDHLQQDSDYDIIIMAGGKGKRLYPITKSLPKAMVKFNGKPIIEIIISKFVKLGFLNFYISVYHLKRDIIKFLSDGKKFGAKIRYIQEKKPLGTAGSLSLLKKKRISDNFLVINCDVITNLNFNEMIKFHLENNSLLTIAVNIVEKHHSFGEIKTDGKRVLSFEEKPIEKKYSNAGIYILNKSILKYLKNNTKIDFDKLINFLLKKKIKIHIFPIHESWLDIGIKKNFMKLRKKIHKF